VKGVQQWLDATGVELLVRIRIRRREPSAIVVTSALA
jgi:hypothetical protein